MAVTIVMGTRREKVLERITATIARYRMFQPSQRVGIAVSGGADSVCLLYVLRELAPRWDLRFKILHLNHHLRGAESEEDAEFVRNLAAEFGLPFTLREAHLPSGGNLEEMAREARLGFFKDEISRSAVDRVALGHTRSDQAETVLLRFLRGAGTAGLAGIRPITDTGLIRPLIAVDRAEVEQFLKDRSIPWREDSTNRSLQFARNRVRHELLPNLARDWNPAIAHTLANTADWALAEEYYWEREINRLAALQLEPGNGFVLLRNACLRELPLAAARRLVRRAMEIVKCDLTAVEFSHVNAVLHLVEASDGHGRLQVPGLDIMRSFEWLRFAKPAAASGLESRNYSFPAAVPGVLPIPGEDYAVSLEVLENPMPPAAGPVACDCVYNKVMVGVDPDRLSGALTLRNWRPGDRYQPAGSGSEQKIKTLFQEFRIPLWERRHWPVLTDANSIVWARRFGPAAGMAAGPGTRRVLTIGEIGIGRGEDNVYKEVKTGREAS